MVKITFDSMQGVMRVDMTIDSNAISVTLMPTFTRWFEVKEVLYADNTQVTGDVKYHYAVLAEKELQAWFIERLKPKKGHVLVSNFSERIEVAFYYRASKLTTDEKRKLTPLGAPDLTLLQGIGQDIVSEYVRLSEQAKTEVREVPSWHDLKTSALKNRRKQCTWSEDRRDFYSSTLGTALGWKRNRIPRNVFEQVDLLKPGLKLAFSIQ